LSVLDWEQFGMGDPPGKCKTVRAHSQSGQYRCRVKGRVVTSTKEFYAEELQNIERGYQDIFIKENLEKTSTEQQPATADQVESSEFAENSVLPKEW
ncbi:hypothetical protein U1Q18_018156, partial [Sarracenia purpurea var. burkii]